MEGNLHNVLFFPSFFHSCQPHSLHHIQVSHANFERHDIIGGMSRTSLHQGYPYVSLRTAYFYERRLIINLDDLFKLPDQDT